MAVCKSPYIFIYTRLIETWNVMLKEILSCMIRDNIIIFRKVTRNLSMLEYTLKLVSGVLLLASSSKSTHKSTHSTTLWSSSRPTYCYIYYQKHL